MSSREKNKNIGIDLRVFMTDILYNQKEYRGYVQSVGNVYCRYETIKPPAYSKNQSPNFCYQYYLVEIDIDESGKKVMLIPRWNTKVSKKDFINSFTTNEWGIKTAHIDGMFFELHQSQDISIALDAYNDTIDIELPRTTGFKMKNGEVVEYPKCRTARGVAHTYLDTQKKKFRFNHDDVVINKKLTESAATLLNWGQPVTIGFANTFQPKESFQDVARRSPIGDFILSDKITIAVSGDVSKFLGVGASAELTWIMRGEDASYFPYGTYTTWVAHSGGGGVSIGANIYQGRFAEGAKTKSNDINRGMLSGKSYGLDVSTAIKWKGLEVGVTNSYAPNVLSDGTQDGSWVNTGIGLSLGIKKKNMITESAFKAIVMETSKAIHLSPEKFDKELDRTIFK